MASLEVMNVAISYSRFSSAIQRDGDSLRRQLEAAKRYCAQHDLQLAETITDEGVSAFRGRNAIEGGLGRFLRAIDSGLVPKNATLIVESLDRLSRDQVSEALELFLRIIRKGISIVTLADGRRYDREALNDFSQLVVSLAVMARAHEESLVKSLRITAAYDRRRELIRAKTCPPKTLATWLEWKNDRVQLIPSRAKIVRRIFQMAREGHGCAGIARIFNREGIPGFRRPMWLQGTIRSILMRKAACGYYEPKRHGVRGEPVPDIFPAVIDEPTWALVNQMRRRDFRKGQGKTSDRNPFGRVLREAETGFSLYLSNGAKRKDGSRMKYFRPSDTQNGTCMRPTGRWERNKFVEAFQSVCAHAAQASTSGVQDRQLEMAASREIVTEYEKKIDRLLDLVAGSNELTILTARKKLEGLARSKSSAEEDLSRLEAATSVVAPNLMTIDWSLPADEVRRNVASNVLKVEVNLLAKSFSVEFLDGRKYRYREMLANDGQKVALITTPRDERPYADATQVDAGSILTLESVRGSSSSRSRSATRTGNARPSQSRAA